MDFDRVDRNIVLLWIDWGLNHLPGILKVAFRSSLINALHQRSLRVSEQCQTQLPSRSVSHQKAQHTNNVQVTSHLAYVKVYSSFYSF